MSRSSSMRPEQRRALRREAIGFVALSLIASALLVGLKVFVGFYSGSHALMVNAIYSLNDILSALAVAICLPLVYRPPSLKHPYGYAKAELIAVGLVSVTVVMFVCFLVVFSIVEITRQKSAPPHYAAIPLAAISMVTTWYLAKRAHHLGQLLESPALETAAEHFHSDATASLAALFGIAGAMLGLYALDPIVAIIEEMQLMLLAGVLLARATRGLMDAAISSEDTGLVERACRHVPGVRKIAHIRSRRAGHQTWVDVGVVVAERISVEEGHRIANEVKKAVRGVLGPSVLPQVLFHGPHFAFESPGSGGSAHA
jgi:cation diffusion facilitator family transporter